MVPYGLPRAPHSTQLYCSGLLRITQRTDGKGGILTIAQEDTEVGRQGKMAPTHISKWAGRSLCWSSWLLRCSCLQVRGHRQQAVFLSSGPHFLFSRALLPKGASWLHHPLNHSPCCLSAPWSQRRSLLTEHRALLSHLGLQDSVCA